MRLLPDEQREALVLIGASGFSYEEAAVDLRRPRRNREEPRLARLLAARGNHEWRRRVAGRRQRRTLGTRDRRRDAAARLISRDNAID